MQEKLPSIQDLTLTIAKYNETLSQAVETYNENLQVVSEEKRFTSQENKEFSDLLAQIKAEAHLKITKFYQQRINEKTAVVQEEMTSFGQDNDELIDSISTLQQNLEQGIQKMQERQKFKDQLMLKLIMNAERRESLVKVFNALKNRYVKKNHLRQQTLRAREFYETQLEKKCFLPWLSLSYKQGLQNKLVTSAQTDIKQIQSHFIEIIKTLRGKIAETEDLIQIKKNAKAEFSYSLSRNLLKTISNLSMEVISLNQVTIKDNKMDNEENVKFLKDINNIMNEKMNDVQKIREKLAPPNQDDAKHRPVIQFEF